MADRVVSCNGCGLVANEPSGQPLGAIPCPRCGSTSRNVTGEAHLTAAISFSVGWKHEEPKPTGGKRLVGKGFVGKSLTENGPLAGTMAELSRHVDVQGNRYREHVQLADGQVVRDVDEPLTDHQQRGSARRRRPS